jgi:putative spermidine/putrescine transport system permease protein
MPLKSYWLVALICPALLFLTLFFVVPLALVASTSLTDPDGGWGFAHYVAIFGNETYYQVLWVTIRISALITLIASVLGYVIAYYLVFVVRSAFIRRLIYIALITPLFTTEIVRAFGWMVILGRKGVANTVLMKIGIVDAPLALMYSQTGIIIGLVYILIPFMALIVVTVLQTIDRSYVEAAADLGAGAVTRFLKITLPLSIPGVLAGSLIVFCLAISAYVTPAVLSGGKMTVMSILIYESYASGFNYPLGAALSIVLLATTVVLITAYVFLIRKISRGGRSYA